MAIAALREWRERSLRTSTDLTEYSSLRFLGHLPVLPAVRRPRAVGAAPAATRTPPITNSDRERHGRRALAPVSPFGEQPAAEPAIRRILKCKSLLFHFD